MAAAEPERAVVAEDALRKVVEEFIAGKELETCASPLSARTWS
jgi:hypothetical protein